MWSYAEYCLRTLGDFVALFIGIATTGLGGWDELAIGGNTLDEILSTLRR
jgi:hypothetical protein